MREGRGAAATVWIGVLGPLSVQIAGQPVQVRSAALRRMLSCLVLRESTPVRMTVLVDALWPRDPPPSAAHSVANHAMRLRSLLGSDWPRWQGDGYVLDHSCYADDRREFESAALAVLGSDSSPGSSVLAAERALSLWRGDPWLELDQIDVARFDRERLNELRASVEERRCEALIRSGRVAEGAAVLAGLTEAEPFRERRWWLRVLALHRLQQRRRSLQVLHEAGDRLREVGLEPGEDLRRLEVLVVADDPALNDLLPPGDGCSPDRADLSAQPRCRPTFVGRSHDLDHLVGLTSSGGAERVALVEGEPGIGKTWLLEELTHRLESEGGTVIRVRCAEDPAGPNRALSTALDEWVRSVSTDALASLIGPLTPALCRVSAAMAVALPDQEPDPNIQPESRRHRLLAAMVDLLSRLADRERTTVVVDDLHWASDSTVDLLRHCVDADTGAGFVAAMRSPCDRSPALDAWLAFLTTRGALDRRPLSPLAVDDVRLMVEARLGRCSPDLADQLHGESGGNAFFVRELIEHRIDRAGGDPDALSEGDTSMPTSIVEVVRARVRLLPLDTQELLDVLAVAGHNAVIPLLDAVVPGWVRSCADAERAGLVHVDHGSRVVSFRHEIIRRALYEQLPSSRRLSLHEALGDALAELDPSYWAGTIAIHYEACAAVDPARAVDSLTAAAALDADAYDLTSASERLARARELGVRHCVMDRRRHIELLTEEGDLRRRAGDRTHQQLLLDAIAMARTDGDPSLLGGAVLAYCRTGPTSAAGVFDVVGAALLDEALETLPRSADDALRARLLAAASMIHSVAPDKARSRELYAESEELARRIGDPAVLGEVLANAYWTVDTLDLMDERDRIADDLVALGGGGDPQAAFEGHRIKFSVHLMRAEAAAADRSQAVMEELLRRVPEPFNRCVVLYQRGTLEVLRSQMIRAASTIDECSTACIDAGLPESRVLAVVGGLTFAMHHQQGRLAELASFARPMIHEQPGIPAWRVAVALVAAEEGDHDEVRIQCDALSVDDFGAFPEDFIWSGGMTGLGLAVATTGDVERCRKVYDRLSTHAGVLSWLGSGSFGPVDLALGDLAMVCRDDEVAARHYEIARRIATDWDAPAFLGWAECGMARVHIARRDHTTASELLSSAVARARRRGLSGVLSTVEAVCERDPWSSGTLPTFPREVSESRS